MTHFDASVPTAAKTVIEVRQRASTLRLALRLSIVGVLVVGGIALYRWWTRGKGGFGWGFGSGMGASSLFGLGGDPSGPGGDATAPGEPGDPSETGTDADASSDDGEGTTESDIDKGGGERPTNTGSGTTGGSSKGAGEPEGDGTKGGSGDGVGGGTGGGVGDSHGDGDGGDDQDASVGVDDGGGEDRGEYEGGGGGVMIAEDLDPPDLSPEKLQALRTTVEDLVLGAVLDPGLDAPNLPPMLHAFDPAFGSVWAFWADVALYYNYPELPWGRLDPENSTHARWIELWMDLYRYALIIDLGENSGEEIEVSGNLTFGARHGDPLRRLLWSGAAARVW